MKLMVAFVLLVVVGIAESGLFDHTHKEVKESPCYKYAKEYAKNSYHFKRITKLECKMDPNSPGDKGTMTFDLIISTHSSFKSGEAYDTALRCVDVEIGMDHPLRGKCLYK